MSSKQNKSEDYRLKPLWAPAASITDNTAQVSAIIDTAGFRGCTLALQVGSWSDADATSVILVEDGDNVLLSDAAAVADANLIGTEAGMAPTFANDNTVCKIGYIGAKRYVRVTFTPAANTGALFISGIAILDGSYPFDQEDQKTT